MSEHSFLKILRLISLFLLVLFLGNSSFAMNGVCWKAISHSCASQPRASEFVAALRAGGAHACARGLVGRILRGGSEPDFEMLNPDLNRKLVMFMDSDGLERLAGLSGNQMLDQIGYPRATVADYVRQGLKFRLVVFPEQDEILPATWENLLLLVRRAWPESNIPTKLEAQLPGLKAHSGPKGYQEIVAMAPTGFQSGKIFTPDLEALPGTLWEVRKFLHDQLNLNPLFLGDGTLYAEGSEGELARVRSREYFGLNGRVDRLAHSATFEISVK